MQKTKSSTTWDAWGETNPGMKRESNEDRILCDSERGIFAVIDGMGGEAAGEVAAQQAVEFIKKRLQEETGTPARRLREAIAGANNEIYRLSELNPQWRGMACVLTVALVDDGMLHIGHVGDSRLYKVHQGAIRKITPDHSPVGQREDSGELSELEAMRHPRRNEVFRDVGSQLRKPDDEGFIDYLQVPFDPDAACILCSDGLSDMLSSREIMEVLLDNAGRPRDSARRLIEQANEAGGKDNVSAIVIEVGGFAAAAAALRAGRSGTFLTLLRGRWAFLLYGLVAGLIASYLWLGPETAPVPVPEIPSVQIPGVLQVKQGSPEYPTIASALEAAKAGDRIEIAAGEYEETIRLKEGVEVVAQSPGKAVLRISRALPDSNAAIMADGIQSGGVAGLAIKAEPSAGLQYGIRISNSNVSISNVEVSGAMTAGILIEGGSGGGIVGSYIHANVGPGIVVSDTAKPLMVGNLLYANGIAGARKQPGLYVTGNSNPEVKRNVFSGNGAEAIRLQRQELRDRVLDNLFVNSGRRPVRVERVRQ